MTAAIQTASHPLANDVGDSYWLPFTADAAVPVEPDDVRRGGRHALRCRGRPAGSRRHGRPLVRQCRPRPAAYRGSDPRGGRTPRFRVLVQDEPSRRVRPRGSPRDCRPGGARPRVLHQFRLGSGRHRAEDRARLPPRPRRCRRTKLIGRAKGYHGMGFGGLSVGGIGRHKRDFGPLLPDVAHLALPYDRSMAFSHGPAATGPATRTSSKRCCRSTIRRQSRR